MATSGSEQGANAREPFVLKQEFFDEFAGSDASGSPYYHGEAIHLSLAPDQLVIRSDDRAIAIQSGLNIGERRLIIHNQGFSPSTVSTELILGKSSASFVNVTGFPRISADGEGVYITSCKLDGPYEADKALHAEVSGSLKISEYLCSAVQLTVTKGVQIGQFHARNSRLLILKGGEVFGVMGQNEANNNIEIICDKGVAVPGFERLGRKSPYKQDNDIKVIEGRHAQAILKALGLKSLGGSVFVLGGVLQEDGGGIKAKGVIVRIKPPPTPHR